MPAAGSPLAPRFGLVGRQPAIDYLTKDYAGFRQGMLDQIPLVLPQWTDRSEADFGVVLIELVAYVADILSYYQDRVANESFLSTATQRRTVTELLRLIGYQIDPGLSASALIHFDMASDSTEVTVTDLPFRLRTSGRQGEPTVDFEIGREFTLNGTNDSIDVSSHPALEASATTIQLPHSAHALSAGDEIYFEQVSEPGADEPNRSGSVLRSPRLTLLAIVEGADGNDRLHWSPPLPFALESKGLTLKGNNVVASHGQTVTETFRGDGTASQRVTLSRPSITHVLRGADGRRRRSSPALELRVGDELWQEVDTFALSGPADNHYVTTVDENDRLSLVFGTGERGRTLPSAPDARAEYRIGIGAAGNVPARTLTIPVSSVAGVTAITNPFPATGGADRESTEEAKISGPGSIVAQERAVTLEDYRLLAQGFPGVAKARARVGLRGGYKVVQIFVAPEQTSPEFPAPPPSELKASLKRHLEGRMPINRMAGVDVLDPVYVPVDITVDVHLRPEASRARVEEQVRQTLADLLAFTRQAFGQPVRAGEIFSVLFPLEGVAFVQLKRLARRDSRTASAECDFTDVSIAEHELAVKGELTVNPIGGQG